MIFDNCYESIEELVSDASKRFDPEFVINEDKNESLEEICEIVEQMVLEFGINDLDAWVDDVTKRLTISWECDDMVFHDGREHPFFSLIQLLNSFSFAKSQNGNIQVNLNIDGLWVKRS